MTARRFGERLLTVGIAASLAVLMMGANRRAPNPIGGMNGGGPKGHSGSLDPSFAGDGTTWSYFPSYDGGTFVDDIAEGVAVDAAGGILVAAHHTGAAGYPESAILRYNTNGAPDMTFGSNGIANAGSGSACAMAIQPDGRILVANGGFDVTRFEADGSLDASFGSGGHASTIVRGLAYGMALQADGRIVVAGYAEPVQGGGAFIALVRYDSLGSLDLSFGSGGVVLSDLQGQARAVTVQPDGRILTAGGSFQVVRFNADGTLDTGFGSGGQITLPFGDYGWDSLAEAILVQPDDRIVVAGGAWTHYDFAIARLEPDGSLDRGFGHGGMVTTDFANGGFDSILALVLQPDGRLVAAGYGGPSHRLPDEDHFALARYEPDGALDRSFGRSGKVVVPIDDLLIDDFARALALQPDGRLVAAGNARTCKTSSCYKSGYALARFLP